MKCGNDIKKDTLSSVIDEIKSLEILTKFIIKAPILKNVENLTLEIIKKEVLKL